VMQDVQLTTDSSTVRLIVLASVCVLLVAACGRAGHVLTLGSTETAVRAAGYSRLRVLDASAAISRLRSDGFDVGGMRAGTPDYVIPKAVPVIYVLRFASVDRAWRVRNKAYVGRVCNVIVYNVAPTIKIARQGADRIVAALRKQCR
jgi:hypothetical protein